MVTMIFQALAIISIVAGIIHLILKLAETFTIKRDFNGLPSTILISIGWIILYLT